MSEAARVTVLEFIAQIGKDEPAPVYLFCPGKRGRAREATFEPLLAERAVEKLVATYVDPSLKDLSYRAFYAEESPPKEIVEEAQTCPFLAERRVVLVRNAAVYQKESAARPLFDYLESPNDTTLLMLVAAQIDKRSKLYKACDKAGQVIECPQLTARGVEQWIKDEAGSRGKKISAEAVQELAARAGNRLGDVNNALEVVVGYVGERQDITGDDVRAACADVAEEEIWTLTDTIAASRTGHALSALRKLTEFGKKPDEILGIINWLLEIAYAVALSGPSPPGVSPFVAKKVAPLARKLGTKKLRDAFALCTDTHFMIRSTGVDENLALELLVVKLAAPGRRKGEKQGL